MTSPLKVTAHDVKRVCQLIADRSQDDYVLERYARNVEGRAPRFNREDVWHQILNCLVTTRQQATEGTPVDRFTKLSPFPLTLAHCGGSAERIVAGFLRRSRIGFVSIISKHAGENYRRLQEGGWEGIEQHFKRLAAQRDREPRREDSADEREASHFAADNLAGIGPKQSRNLWQGLKLTRYEIPLDGRVAKWISRHLSVTVDFRRLGSPIYYEAVLDYVQEVCERGWVLPCVFDAAAFDHKGKATPKD